MRAVEVAVCGTARWEISRSEPSGPPSKRGELEASIQYAYRWQPSVLLGNYVRSRNCTYPNFAVFQYHKLMAAPRLR